MELRQQRDLTLADVLVDRLCAMGVRMAFGVPGGAIEPFMDALARASKDGRIRVVIARNEAGAAYMAYGWWLENGTPAVVVTTTGPGAANAIAGVAGANMDGIPMYVITAQVSSKKNRRNALQECSEGSLVDSIAMYSACTGFSVPLTHPQQLDHALAEAYVRSRSGIPAPVHLSIPTDLLRSPLVDAPPTPKFDMLDAQRMTYPNAARVHDAHMCIEMAMRPAVLIGDAADKKSAWAGVQLAHRIGATFCASPLAMHLLPQDDRCFRGCFGFAGHDAATEAIREADAVILVDSSCGELESASWGAHASRIVHFSSEPMRLMRTPNAVVNVLCTPHVAIEQLLGKLRQRPHPKKVAWLPTRLPASNGKVRPQVLMRSLAERLPKDAVIYSDAGNAFAWATQHLHRPDRTGPHRMSLRYASMGWTVGACVGAALSRKRPVVTLIGDGALLMAGQEFSAAVHERLPIAFIVLNDSALGMVRHGQILGGAERMGWEIPSTDFAAFARSMGGNGVKVTSEDDLGRIDFDAIFSADGPTLIDVIVDETQVPPMFARINAIADMDPFAEEEKDAA